jgi:hypothetical protein
MCGGKGFHRVQEAGADARPTSTREHSHAPNVEFGSFGHRGDHADDRVRDLSDPDGTLCKALGDLVRGWGRRAEGRRCVKSLNSAKAARSIVEIASASFFSASRIVIMHALFKSRR